jgi:voltage-gated potassium channel
MLSAMKGRLYRPETAPGLRSILLRLGLVLGLVFAVVLVLYFEEGLVDNKTGSHPGFLDCIYFALITITTVGYGDIVPVTTQARLVDGLLLTPVRFIVLAIFFGTAYQLTIQTLREDYLMKRTVRNLSGHVIVCGFGGVGHAAVKEMLLQGTPPDQLVVIALDADHLSEASELGVVAIQGDATRESVLQSVAIERAAHILVCPGRDDTAVLIALTARDLNPTARLVVVSQEEENVRLLQRSGADLIISPAWTGGNMMAAATRQEHLADTLSELLSVAGAIALKERPVRDEECGRHPRELPDIAVVRVYRNGAAFDVPDFPRLEPGDAIVYVRPGRGDVEE